VLIKRMERHTCRGAFAVALPDQPQRGLDRRSFLRRSGLVAGSLATLGALPLTTLREAEAGPPPPPGAQVTPRKNISCLSGFYPHPQDVGCFQAPE
jgi:formate dehydrogenase major subunit